MLPLFQSPRRGDGECGIQQIVGFYDSIPDSFSPLMAGTVSAGHDYYIRVTKPKRGFSPLMAGTVSAGGGVPGGGPGGVPGFQSPHGGDGECGSRAGSHSQAHSDCRFSPLMAGTVSAG